MAPPLLWLVSDAAAQVTGRRFLAVHWDASLRRTAAGIVPIQGTDPAARQDALARVPAFLARFLLN